MNVHDSEKMTARLKQSGWENVDAPENADAIVLHTCAVRVKAEQKVFSRIGRLSRLKKTNPDLKLVLTGCMAPAWGSQLFDRSPSLDLVVGPGAIQNIEILLERSMRSDIPLIEIAESDDIFTVNPLTLQSNSPHQAWVTIMEGCDNYCSYCIVPFVRGRERSRPAKEILEEVRILVSKGICEVTLLGQNVNSYSGHSDGFRGLLRDLQEITSLMRIRFTTSHPKDINNHLIEEMSKLSKICEYLHFPAQSGSTKILQQMNRKYSKEEYLAKVRMIRSYIPNIALSSDFIIGFPGETDVDFQETFDLVNTIRFDNIFAFKYSVRPRTAASELHDDVPEEVKSARLSRLIETQRHISLQNNTLQIGETVEVLIEGKAKRGFDKLTGRTRQNRIVNFLGSGKPGSLVQVVIDSASPNCLYGRIRH
jgi:tRNA-2-methylthio-N6-dimethylallyladenosine synthase